MRHLKYQNQLPMKEKVGRLFWNAAWLVLFRPTPRWIMHGWRRFLLRAFGARIGEGSKIAPSCFVWAPWNLEMGSFSALADHVDCYNVAPIVIGAKVAVSQRSFLCTATHDYTSLLRPLVTRSIVIGNHAWIAAEAMIQPGVRIGEGSVVGARAVVTRDTQPWAVYVGCPAAWKGPRIVTDAHLDPDIAEATALSKSP